jgi:hypothetical protein
MKASERVDNFALPKAFLLDKKHKKALEASETDFIAANRRNHLSIEGKKKGQENREPFKRLRTSTVSSFF